ncbi:MAG: hypothetical protein AABX03_01880 [Nanoarchaeota archaeon]
MEEEYPEDIGEDVDEVLLEEILEGTSVGKIKNPIGRPIGIPATQAQKDAVGKAAKEYQRKLKEGLIEKEPWETHGAYSYLSGGRVPKKKRYLLEFVHKEREKWLEELGGSENLSSIELSMLDEASRLLLFSSMVNDYLLCDKDTNVLYKDEDGDVKMHTAVSRHYLSFTKTYISILKELQKIVAMKPSAKKGGMKKDSASRIQSLYSKNEKD